MKLREFIPPDAASAYSDTCPRPNGKVLVKQIDQKITETQGYVARDDSRKEIIAAFRGT